MVISPDCDLVPRGNKMAAARLLTVGGVVKGLEEDGAYAGELVWLDSSKGDKMGTERPDDPRCYFD